MMQTPGITEAEFAKFQAWIHSRAGIRLSLEKRALVCGRLHRRLLEHGLTRYGDYFQLIKDSAGEEAEIALNLLTTNETCFFREPKHFEFFRDRIVPQASLHRCFRVWSAACSTGEEPYSLAMVLSESLGGRPWQVVGSDINSSVLTRAVRGCYPLEATRGISANFLHRFCLRGVRSQKGTFLIGHSLRERVQFFQINLNRELPEVGEFDVIFLRNVLIYFDVDTKAAVVKRLLTRLRPGGYFIVGHSETLHGVSQDVRMLAPTIYTNTK